jgi:hypothetical protein
MERIAGELNVEPTRISFVAALRHFVEQWLWASQISLDAFWMRGEQHCCD